jgi:hypothetical protein
MSLSRPTASSITRKIACTASVVAGMLGFAAAPALAKDGLSGDQQAPAAVNAVLAVCPNQTFSQPFEALGDVNYYTLVEGSEFNSPSEGWELLGGAHVVGTTRPDGSIGSALDLPGGSAAVSPPVCVTLQYPTARMWTNTVQGKSNVAVSVAYANTRTAGRPKQVDTIQEENGGQGNKEDASWTLSRPFDVRPELGGKVEETRQVRFTFTSSAKGSDVHLYGLYVDPRMR